MSTPNATVANKESQEDDMLLLEPIGRYERSESIVISLFYKQEQS
jgi:hypothetical protein